MARCPACKHTFAVLEDEQDMHGCPFCGYGDSAEDHEQAEDEPDEDESLGDA